MAKIFIAAGHALPGIDGGASSPYGVEAAIAMGIVDTAVALCAGQNKNGREIVKVPHEYNLDRTVPFINSNSTDQAHDLCIEVHLNSNAGAPGTGTETYYGLVDLAREIHEEVVRTLNLRDRGIKDGNMFIFNNSTKCGSCLVEMGFVNNQADVAAIVAHGGLALARGIIRACGGTYVEKVTTPAPAPVEKPAPVVVETPKPITPEVPVVQEEKLNVGLLNRLIEKILEIIKRLIGEK